MANGTPSGHTEQQLYASVGFAPQQTADPNHLGSTGGSLASFLLNVPDNAYRRNVNIAGRPGGVMGLYAQDEFRIKQRLTLNVGLRCDRTFIPSYGTEASVGTQGSTETDEAVPLFPQPVKSPKNGDSPSRTAQRRLYTVTSTWPK